MADVPDDLAFLDAVAHADLVRRGAASPLELVDAAIARIEKLNPELNAVIYERFDRARAEAASDGLPDGPFRGVPLLLKDLITHSAGDPYHEGMRLLKDLAWTEDRDAYLVQRFRAAGFVLLGKTNTPELGIAPTTEPEAYGPTRNPWDGARTPGGSSGGSAAAVATGMVPVAHANDLGGSIRVPASACGIVGLKPTRARTSLGYKFGDLMSGLVHEHVVTRSVRDTATVLDAVAMPMPGDPYVAPAPARPYQEEVGADPGRLRVGLMRARPFGSEVPVHPDCVAAAQDAARLLESLGHSVEEAHPSALDQPEAFELVSTMFVLYATYALNWWERRLARPIAPEQVETLTWALVEVGRSVSAVQYLTTVERMHIWSRQIAEWWEGGFDLLLTPTLSEPPPTLGTLASKSDGGIAPAVRGGEFAPFTMIFNITGQPAISLPLSWNEAGLPIGVQLAAGFGREDVLVRVAAQLEQARPWADRRPPASA